MTSKLDSLRREPVEVQKRRSVTKARYDRVFKQSEGKCYVCGDSSGPFDIEHPTALALGGSDRDEDLRLICALRGSNRCHRTKTQADVSAIAKSKRLAKKEAGEQRKPKFKIASRPFGKQSRKLQSRGFRA